MELMWLVFFGYHLLNVMHNLNQKMGEINNVHIPKRMELRKQLRLSFNECFVIHIQIMKSEITPMTQYVIFTGN